MKIVDQTIPPELQEAYDSLISNDPTGGGGDLTARTRRAARYSKRWMRYTGFHWIPAAEWIAERSGYIRGSSNFEKEVRRRIRELRDGYFDPEWWMELSPEQDEFFLCTGSGPEETSPPPYGYRNANFLPQEVTYSAGSLANGPARSYGQIHGLQWNDEEWVYRRTVFPLLRVGEVGDFPPVAWAVDGTVKVDASDRGSRPMFSLMVRPRITNPASPAWTERNPPREKSISLYFRFVQPDTPPPYLHTVKARHSAVAVSQSSDPDASGTLTKLLVDFSVRPMFGLGFNNNSEVANEFTGEPRAYQLNPCARNKLEPPQAQYWRSYYPGAGPEGYVAGFILTDKPYDLAFAKAKLLELAQAWGQWAAFTRDSPPYNWFIQPASYQPTPPYYLHSMIYPQFLMVNNYPELHLYYSHVKPWYVPSIAWGGAPTSYCVMPGCSAV